MRKQFAPAAVGVSLGVMFAMAAGVGDAAAQIPGDDGVFHACVRMDRDNDEARLVRLVTATEPCRPRERRVQWNVVGQQGPTGLQGLPGVPGAQGIQGEQGQQGAPGPQGVSVAMDADAAEGCGTLGGVKLTLVDSLGRPVPNTVPQYICNGKQGPQGEPGQPGTTGQSATTYLSNNALNLTTTSCTFIPGYPVGITVPEDADVLLQSDGGVNLPAPGITAAIASVDVFLVVDNATSAAGTFYGIKRVFASNTPAGAQQIGYWSLMRRVTLSAGGHTVGVCAALSPGTTTGAIVGGGANTFAQTGVTVTFINK